MTPIFMWYGHIVDITNKQFLFSLRVDQAIQDWWGQMDLQEAR